jgi:hypothetical protein
MGSKEKKQERTVTKPGRHAETSSDYSNPNGVARS